MIYFLLYLIILDMKEWRLKKLRKLQTISFQYDFFCFARRGVFDAGRKNQQAARQVKFDLISLAC